MKNSLEIGSRIRNLREHMALSRDAFSERINISEIFLSQIERGQKSISLNTLVSICENTGCSADYLLFGKSDENSSIKMTLRLLSQLPPEANFLVYDIIDKTKSIYEIGHRDDREDRDDKVS